VFLKTHEHYIDKEAAHAFVDGIRDRCTKHQRLTGSEETPSSWMTQKQQRKPSPDSEERNWKKKRLVQYDVPLPLRRAITMARKVPLRSGRNFGMAVGYSGRSALRGKQCDMTPQS
jgi:hypothetical protein